MIVLHAVDDDKAAAVHGVAGHEGFGQEVQGGAVDHHPGAAHGVDEGPAGGVAHDVDLAALGAVHEGLAHVAVDHQLAPLHDLAQLVLGVAVDVNLHAVDAGGQVVAGAAVGVDAHLVGVEAEAAAQEALPPVAVADEVPPAQLEGPAQEAGVAVVALPGEIRRRPGSGSRPPGAGLPGSPGSASRSSGSGWRVSAPLSGEACENPGQGLLQQAEQVAALLFAGVVAPVQEQGQGLMMAAALRSSSLGASCSTTVQEFQKSGIGP